MSNAGLIPCQFLEWDSHHFRQRIARVNSTQLTEEAMPLMEDWCRVNKIDCLYFLADMDPPTIRLAEKYKFALIDIRVTLAKILSAELTKTHNPHGKIRPFQSSDLPALKQMAGRLHRDSRFFVDPHFSESRSRSLFEIWIEKSCLNPMDRVLVSELDGTPVGYIACHRDGAEGQVQLIAVDSAAQGKGIGTNLIQAALSWFSEAGVSLVTVVTQGRNLPAQKLYQKCGFSTQSMQLWYHRWFGHKP